MSTADVVAYPNLATSPARVPTHRAIGILIALNALPTLLIPVLIGLVNGGQFSDRAWLPYLLITLIAIIHAQLFLLAFWLSFGGWPKRWRTLGVFSITIACGLYLGLTVAVSSMLSVGAAAELHSWILAFVLLFMTPLVASGVLWMLSSIFILPAWWFGFEIAQPAAAALPAERPKRTFEISQLLIWTAQVALPLGSLNIFLTIWEDRMGALRTIAPFLAVLISGTPLAVALLIPKISARFILVSCAWCLAVGAMLWVIPISWTIAVPWQTVFVFAIMIAANLIALRQLGFCWQVRVA
jgi:hypothetical protein